MHMSKEDMFGNATAGAAGAKVVFQKTMDFGKHGDDIYHRLFLIAQCVNAGVGAGASVTFTWETSPDNATWEEIKVWGSFGVAELKDKAFLIKNSVLQRNMKRYQRLSVTATGSFSTAPEFFAFLTDGREEPLE